MNKKVYIAAGVVSALVACVWIPSSQIACYYGRYHCWIPGYGLKLSEYYSALGISDLGVVVNMTESDDREILKRSAVRYLYSAKYGFGSQLTMFPDSNEIESKFFEASKLWWFACTNGKNPKTL